MWWSCTVRFFLSKFSVLKIAKFCFPRIRFKRQVDNSLVVHNPELDFTDDDKMNMKFDIDLDLNQLLNETQMEDNEFPITVIHIWCTYLIEKRVLMSIHLTRKKMRKQNSNAKQFTFLFQNVILEISPRKIFCRKLKK